MPPFSLDPQLRDIANTLFTQKDAFGITQLTMWTARTGQQVDGVLSVDIAGLRQILPATGPVQAAGMTVAEVLCRKR